MGAEMLKIGFVQAAALLVISIVMTSASTRARRITRSS
jgi:hypothetical protein